MTGDALRDVASSTLRRPQLPLALLALVVCSLLVQSWIERRDPTLAGGAVDREPDLVFGPLRSPVPLEPAGTAA